MLQNFLQNTWKTKYEKLNKLSKAKTSLEVYGVQWEAKLLRERKFQGNNATFVRQRFT